MKKRYEKPLTHEELMALPDDQIDTSDIPELDENFWKNAKVTPVTPPRTKPNISMRLPEDIIAFFKAESPKGFTGRMAAVLTAYVQSHEPK